MREVLVIEDEAGLRRIIARALRAAGHGVLEADNGRSGLEMLRRHDPVLIITDLLMPDKDGLEIIRELRGSSNAIKILATSGGGVAGQLDFLDVASEFGADLILRKPFRIDELLSAVAQLLGPEAKR